jgi:two-component system LytT family response regulator
LHIINLKNKFFKNIAETVFSRELKKLQKLKLKKYSYIIIDNDTESVLKTRIVAEGFSELTFIASATNFHQGLNLVLEHRPAFIFLEIDPQNSLSNLSLSFISELYRYLSIIPKIIITTTTKDLAFEAIQYNVFDYVIKPLTHIDLLKTLLKFEKTLIEAKEANSIESQTENSSPAEVVSFKEVLPVEEEKIPEIISTQEIVPVIIEETALEEEAEKEKAPEIISTEEIVPIRVEMQFPAIADKPFILCIKSYGDYRYLNAADIAYFQADNNSTDVYLNSGEMITAFKTLKHFESILSYPFIRIHNSYIINRNYIARIHNGNSVCYIKNSPKKIPFSKTYKSNVDLIIADFAAGNYIEI